MTHHGESHISAIERLAGELLEEQDPRWKDVWERGYDAGRLAAGRELKAAIESAGP